MRDIYCHVALKVKQERVYFFTAGYQGNAAYHMSGVSCIFYIKSEDRELSNNTHINSSNKEGESSLVQYKYT
jgi:hypothetical protein